MIEDDPQQKPARRILFNGLAVVSAALCLAVAVFGLRSFVVGESVGIAARHEPEYVGESLSAPVSSFLFVGSEGGRLQIQRNYRAGKALVIPPYDRTWTTETFNRSDKDIRHWMIPGITLFSSPFDLRGGREHVGYSVIIVDWWLLAIISAVLPVSWIVIAGPGFIEKRRVRRRGRCACGYDLRATPLRCPECGAEPVPTR
ncbi:MAG TPA: hypothetical protein VH370_11210 [Humisphaera sp.]|jgi:hypothetical protein|nr:hypothetical protein [Humisphaera sp.]